MKDEWTDFCDIGKVFNGEIFTSEMYFSTEKKYIRCVLDILDKLKIQVLNIVNIENYTDTNWHRLMLISKEEIINLLSDCLQGKCWCELQADEFVLCFGYELYMYFKLELTEEEIHKIVSDNGLFIEKVKDWPWDYTL